MKKKYNVARTREPVLNKSDMGLVNRDEMIHAFYNMQGVDNISQQVTRSGVVRNRLQEYQWRNIASRDGLVKSIVSSHAVDAIGIEDTERPNISIVVSEKYRKILPTPLIKYLDEEIGLYLSELLNPLISTLEKDALCFGDAYVSIRGEYSTGISDIVYNLGCKPWCITPYKSNLHNKDVGYTVQQPIARNNNLRDRDYYNDFSLGNATRFIKSLEYVSENEKQTVFVGRFNLHDGTLESQLYDELYVDAYNPFTESETYYQDSIHSGLLEGQKEYYDRYISSIIATNRKKIASSMVERWIAINMNNSSPMEREALKNSMSSMIQKTEKHRKGKMDSGDTSPTVVSYVVPTTGENGTGGFSLQESSLKFDDDLQDVMFNAKALIGGMKFHPQYTAFSDDSQGERQDDSVARTSEQMEEVGGAVRSSITKLYRDVIAIHLHYLGRDDIKDDVFKIQFNAVTLQSKKEQEIDRIDNLNNQAQFNDMISVLRDLFNEETEDNVELLKDMLKDSIPLNITNKDEFLERVVRLVFSKEPESPAD